MRNFFNFDADNDRITLNDGLEENKNKYIQMNNNIRL